MTKKEFGRMIAFALVVCLMLICLCEVFELNDTTNIAMRFKKFYNLEENTVDAVWIGTSGSDRYWMAPKAYEEYGMTVYPLAVDAMPTWLFINMIEEAQDKHDTKLFIIDLRAYGQNNTKKSAMDVRARRVLDAMPFFSVNRLKVAFKTMEEIQKVTGEKSAFELSYLLPYIKYHSKWSEEDFSIKNNVSDAEHSYLGFYMNKKLSVKQSEQEPYVYDADYFEELDPIAEDSLYELLDYIKEHELNVLFVDTPQYKSEMEMGRANTVCKILDEYGVPYLNFSATDENGDFPHGLELDHEKDFYNEGHVNYYGAEKFTAVMAAYIDANYDLPDRRNDEAVREDWDGVYDKILKQIEKWEK